MRLSVIIPAHNEEELLPGTLRSIRSGSRPPDEILVACDRCSDGTADLARSWGARVTVLDRGSISAARNDGARDASGDVFVFLDADTQISPTFLHLVAQATTRGAEHGTALLRPETAHPVIRARIAGMNVVTRTLGAWYGSGGFVTRTAFRAAGGYDERLTWGEDVEFAYRLSRFGRCAVLSGAWLRYCERRFRERGYVRETVRRGILGLRHCRRGPPLPGRRSSFDTGR